MSVSTNTPAFHTEGRLAATAKQLPSLKSDESIRLKLQSTLKSRNLPALQQALEAATQRELRGAEVERAKQLLNLLAAAFSPRAQPQLRGAPQRSSGGGVVPTQQQVHTAPGYSGAVVSPTQSKMDAALAGSNVTPPTQPHFQWTAGDHGGSTAALMQHAASCLCGSIGISDWKPGYYTPGSMELLHVGVPPVREMPSAKPLGRRKRECGCDSGRMHLDRNGRPWFYKCEKCSNSKSLTAR